MRVLLLTTALLASVTGCKKKVEAETTGVTVPPVNPVDMPLQIAAVTPSNLDAQTAVTIEVIGSGFKAGASVRVGDIAATRVQVQDENILWADLPGLATGIYDLAVQNTDANETVRRGGISVRDQVISIDLQRCGQVVLYFQTDATGLDTAARGRIDGVMDCYLGSTGPIEIVGHADERGTTDYNLALGQRRAETVQQVLISAGVPRSRLPTSSYGEERPASGGWGEAAWAKNRRVELTLIR